MVLFFTVTCSIGPCKEVAPALLLRLFPKKNRTVINIIFALQLFSSVLIKAFSIGQSKAWVHFESCDV